MIGMLSYYDEPKTKLSGSVTKVGHKGGILVSGITIGVVFSLDIIQFVLCVISDRRKVLLLCKYVEKPSLQESRLYDMLATVACSVQWLKPWGNKLCQHHFLKSCYAKPPKWKYNYFTPDFLVNPGRGYQECARLELSKEFKRAVLA